MNKYLEFDCIIYDCYKDLLKKKIYEPIILKIMNASKDIFSENYKYIENQSHRESDFVSSTGIMYDAKILFYNRQCQALAINKDNLYTFVSELQKEINEVYEAVSLNDKERLINSIFYKEMENRIKKAEERENIILFMPFACTLEVSNRDETLLKEDIFTVIFKCLLEENASLIAGHNIYIIYPNVENYVIIKKLNDGSMELIDDCIFSKYIKFKLR